MKHIITKITALLAIVSLGVFSGCHKVEEEFTELNLNRCLEPMNLNAKVSDGDNVTFSWDQTLGADIYALEVYSDPEMSTLVFSESLKAEQIPYKVKLEADASYYFQVQAQTSLEGKEYSKWAVYDKEIKTYAIKSNLFMKVSGRTATTLSFTWTADPEVERLEYAAVGTEGNGTKALTAAEIAAGAATIEGLKASTNYVVTLYFKSANRGEVNLWTIPDLTGTTRVSSSAALQQALADKAPKILVGNDSTSYKIGSTLNNILSAVEIYGEASVDGTFPILYGEFTIAAAFSGGKIHFENVELNGNADAYGFAIQLPNGGTAAKLPIESIVYKNCNLTGYSKGLIYEWGQTMVLGELCYDNCLIYNINAEGAGGGDVIDYRGASEITKLTIKNNTIYQGMRTFVRADAGTVLGSIAFENNTIMNLNFIDNTNNGGLLGIKSKPANGVSFKNNLILYMEGKASIIGTAAANLTASEAGITFANNCYYSLPETFFNEKVSQSEALGGSGKILAADPCYNAKGGVFNLTDTDLSEAGVGAAKWLTPYVEEPEDLTLPLLEEAKTWNFSDAKYFVGPVNKSKVRDNLLMSVSSNPITIDGGIMGFTTATTLNRKKVPTDGYIAFKVNKPGSVMIVPKDAQGLGNHLVIAVGDVEGSAVTVKGGAAYNSDMTTAQKILISDITEESLVYIYASGAVEIEKLAWSNDLTQVNTALATPEPVLVPEQITQGTAADVAVNWPAIDNAASYSVVFNGKSYPVTEPEYVIASDVVKFLDAGGYVVSVFANPGEKDIYNTQSSAGKATLVVAPKSGGGSSELVVNSVEELTAAIASGKVDITLAYSPTAHNLGTLALTTPLRLKGQTSGANRTAVTGNITVAGDIAGSITFTNILFDGTGSSASVIKEADAVIADTIGFFNCIITDQAKALYDNSGKKVSNVQYLIFDNVQANNTSKSSDMIDMRAGAYHNLIIRNSTFANSARTFIRTDAGSEINTAIIRNNTFYKLCTIATSKDNNGLFHIRSTAGSGMRDYRIVNNIFYSIPITTAPENAAGYPKFISKNSAALKPHSIVNNYFYNIEETNADYSWWTVNCSREEGIAGGGCVLSADPFKDAENGDYTLTNGVAMNANIGDPRWNPMAGGTPSSEIAVENVTDLLTAISAGKTTITLKTGDYDLTALTEVAGVDGGVLTLTTSLNLIGESGANFIGGIKLSGAAIGKFSATGVNFSGNSSIQNMIEIADAEVNVSSVSLKNCSATAYKNRLFYSNVTGTIASLEINGLLAAGMGTGGDFIDIRKGTVSAVKVANSTFANGIRTFMRMDAAVICASINVANNTFYNLGYVDSKDNNGIFHVRSTSVTPEAFKVTKNLFGYMHRAVDAPSNANGYPKIISTNTANIIPTFTANYYWDFDTTEGYSWWSRTDEATCTAGYGIILTESPFTNPASENFTLTNALAMSENIGDPRWNPQRGTRPDEAFKVSSVAELLTAISAGKTSIALNYGVYDLTSVTDAAITDGVLTLATTLDLKGITRNGLKPEFKGGFKLSGTTIKHLTLRDISMNGKNSDASNTVGNMIELSDATLALDYIKLTRCDIADYKNRLISQSAECAVASYDLSGLLVSNMGTGGDFFDIRKGTANLVKITNSTFYNGIRTFIRMDAAVVNGAVTIKNNTFYNLCYVDSKDNNGILHVRATSLSATNYVVENNIFSTMHRAVEAPANANGYPKLVSANTASKIPVFRNNLFYDFDTTENLSWWNRIDEATAIANGGAVLSETPFAGDPATGNFTVKGTYKGIGDIRW